MLINSVTPAVTAIAQNFDNIKAVVIALGAAISAKLVVQCAVLAKEFVIGVAQGMAYQMQLSALQGQALRTATAMGVLRSASALLGGPAGLGMLAFQGLAAGAAFLYMKRSSDEAVPALSTQGKTVAQLREEYEKLDKAQQRVLTRQATADLSKAEQGFRKQEIALLGLVRALISHSDASETDKKTAKDLYDQYLQGKLNADQLATGINNLRTVEAKHKTGIDEKAAAVNKERKAVIDAQGVLKTYNDVVKQGTKDNKSHTDSINDKANALANLTAKQMEYVRESNKQTERERYIQHNMKVGGISRERAEHMADARESAGMGYSAKEGSMPEAVKQAEEAEWKLKQAADAREQAEKKAEESRKRQADFAEKNYKFTQQELKMLKEVADLSAKYKLDEIGAKYGIPENYLAGLMAQESKGDPNAVSPTGAVGYFQTTHRYRKDNNISIDDSKNLPVIADVVARNLASAYEKLGSWEAAIRSHNAGVAGSHQFEKTGRVNGSAARNKEVANFSPTVGKWIAGLGGSSLKSKGLADPNSPEALLEYKKFEEKKVESAEEAEKKKLALQYKYADERKQIAIDLDNAIKEIEKSTLSGDEQINAIVKAEQEAADKVKEIDIRELQRRIEENELVISGKEILAQRIYEIEMAQLQALFDAGKISNVEKVRREKEFEDKLTAIKRIGLEERLDLETKLGKLTGESEGVITATNNLGDLDNQKKVSDIQAPGMISDAQMQDFEDKFGGLTSRMSGLWDKGIQAMMNGTLTWKNAMNAIFTELAGAFVQSMITAPMKKYAASLATRLAVKLGFIKTETAAEVAGQAAQTGAVVAGETAKTTATGVGVFARIGLKIMETIKSVMMSAWEAMAKTMASIPFPLNIALGAAAFAGVAGIVGKIASARGGYDIPAGVNPVTQLHEEEMVLPKQHANTIRALGKSLSSGGGIGGGGGSSEPPVYFSPTIQAWDSKDVKRFMKKHGRELAESLSSFNRNFGKP
ncbi:transglycosylase SLT domain-containing protein [Acinetobacter lwoffii]|nr:transglycosylase SLT domain-containing protein [Acinetobacter lwoffii]